MPTHDDLMGFGLNPELAIDLGNQPSQVACLGTSQGAAVLIMTKNTELVPSSSNTGAILSSGAKVGSPHFFFNNQSTSAVIYCPVSDFLNSTLNNSLTLAQNKAAIIVRYKVSAGVGYWSTILTA